MSKRLSHKWMINRSKLVNACALTVLEADATLDNEELDQVWKIAKSYLRITYHGGMSTPEQVQAYLTNTQNRFKHDVYKRYSQLTTD